MISAARQVILSILCILSEFPSVENPGFDHEKHERHENTQLEQKQTEGIEGKESLSVASCPVSGEFFLFRLFRPFRGDVIISAAGQVILSILYILSKVCFHSAKTPWLRTRLR